MRFFFQCVTCFSVTNPPPTTTVTPPDPDPEPTSPTEETRSLVTQRRRKRTTTRGSSADWKPSLFAISEDNAASATPMKVVDRQLANHVASSRNVKRCGPSSVQANARYQSHDFSREPVPIAFPAFSATPFMF